jgi:uncharacterized membrane protein
MSLIPQHFSHIYITGVLFIIVWLGEWLGDKPFFKHLSTGLMVIIFGAIAANTGIIPATQSVTPVYDIVFGYVAPLSIFLVLLGVDLSHVKEAGKPMLLMFFIGSLATVMGVIISFKILNSVNYLGEYHHAIAGMLTGTYIGGSLNFNAIALHYNVSKEGDLFTAVTVADNVISAVWVAVTLVMPVILKKFWPSVNSNNRNIKNDKFEYNHSEAENINVQSFSIILSMAVTAFIVSQLLQRLIPQIPMILWLTTIALIIAQLSFIKKISGHKTLGMFAMYLFLAVVGTHCDIGALLKDGLLALQLMVLVTTIVIIHGIIIFTVGYFLKQDKEVVSIASQANIGGVATALALANSLHRNDLILPAVIIGALGNALGTYYGFMIAEWFGQ